MTDWQPIETAPKDGTRIIVYSNGPSFSGAFKNRWNDENIPWVGEVKWREGWYNEKINGWMIANCDEEYGYFVEATHWMELPEFPK